MPKGKLTIWAKKTINPCRDLWSSLGFHSWDADLLFGMNGSLYTAT